LARAQRIERELHAIDPDLAHALGELHGRARPERPGADAETTLHRAHGGEIRMPPTRRQAPQLEPSDTIRRVGDLPPDLERIFAELHEQVGGTRPEVLSAAYLKALEEIEQLPCNRSGEDKSWVLGVERRWRETLRSARLAR